MRKSPVNHYRKSHTRNGKVVSGGYVGNGSAVNPTFKYPTVQNASLYDKWEQNNYVDEIKNYRKWAKENPNFMTPHIISVERHKGKIIEVSSGSGFNNNTIYGVSIMKKTEKGFSGGNDLSKGGFTSKSEAIAYKNKIKSKMSW